MLLQTKLKRLVAKESLRKPYKDQILAAGDFYNFHKESSRKIHVILVLNEEIESQPEIVSEAHTVSAVTVLLSHTT